MDSQYYNAQSSNSNYTYYPPPHLPPNPYSLHPPGVNPPNSYHYPTPFVGYGTQTPVNLGYQMGAPSYYQDTQTVVANDAIQIYGAAPQTVGYSPAIDSLPSNLLYQGDPNNQSSYPLAIDDMQRVPKMSKVLQAMHCEVCKIDCNSQDALDKHMQGKKHKNALRLQQQATNKVVFPAYASMPQGTLGSSLLGSGGDLAIKTQKLLEGGAAVDSVMTCSICNVVCNNLVVFSDHLAGRKHAAQASMLLQNRMVPTMPTIVQSAWCEICSIDCTSQEVLNIHRAGKKHQKNLGKLRANNTQGSNSSQITGKSVIGPQENPLNNNGNAVKRAKKKAGLEQDVETKRRKVVSEGAAANEVRVCTICKVVCNSQVVFHTHLVGHKHISMVKKHAAEANGSATPTTRISGVV